MTKRMLDATASDFLRMNASDLARSIRETEGRTVSAEIICHYESPVEGVSLGELSAAFGADIITLDFYDPDAPAIVGIPREEESGVPSLQHLKELVGLPIAINMALTGEAKDGWLYSRRYSKDRMSKAVNQGADIVFLYGDPTSGKTVEDLVEVVQATKEAYGDELMLVGVPDVTLPPPVHEKGISDYKQAHAAILKAGAEGIGLVMPGSKQGWRIAPTAELTDHVHSLGGLVWLIMTGSVEGSPRENIQQMALNAKMVGGDVYRLDEAGLSGMPLPENILEFSLTVRGKRHTYRRMALSAKR